MFDFVEENVDLAQIKVVGVGGAGGNAVNRMIEADLSGVEFLAINTDVQALRTSEAHHKLQIGSRLTRGLGSGGDPNIGRLAVEEDEETITDHVHGSDMIFVTAGMGGGTGTGAAPFVARVAREMDALTVGIVTKPFLFEGAVRMRQAEEGIEALKEAVDTLIVIPNERLLEVVPPNTSIKEAFRFADNILYEATRGIYEIISRPNLVNLDFADVRACMKDMGVALMGTGRAEGEDRAVEAARRAICSPLLEDVDIAGAKAVLVNLLAADLQIAEISAAMSHIQNAAGSQAHIMFGYGTDESLGETLQVTVIATGFNVGVQRARPVAVREFLPRQGDEAPAVDVAGPEEPALVAEADDAGEGAAAFMPDDAFAVSMDDADGIGPEAEVGEATCDDPVEDAGDRCAWAAEDPDVSAAEDPDALFADEPSAGRAAAFVDDPRDASIHADGDARERPAIVRFSSREPRIEEEPAPAASPLRAAAAAAGRVDSLERACRDAAVVRDDGLEMIVPEGMSPTERSLRESGGLADELRPVPVQTVRRETGAASLARETDGGGTGPQDGSSQRRGSHGFLTDALGGDLEAPAYTRKYLD